MFGIRQVVFIVFALMMLGGLAYFKRVTDDSRFRLASLKCQENFIHHTEGDADFLVLGSSRTMQGIDPVVVAEQFEDEIVVVNLGRSWRGNGQFYHMARDFMETRKVRRALILELSFVSYKNRRSRLYANGYYPNYTLVTRAADFATDFISTPRDPFYLRVRDYLMNHIDSIDTRLSRFFEGHYLDGWSLWSESPTGEKAKLRTGGCFTKDNRLKAEVLSEKEKSILVKHTHWSEVENRGWDLNVINNDRHSFYIEKFKELAAANGIGFYLMLVPRYLESPQTQSFIDLVQKKYDVPLIAPGLDIRRSIYDAQGFTDITHMGTSGRTLFSAWLGKRLQDFRHGK